MLREFVRYLVLVVILSEAAEVSDSTRSTFAFQKRWGLISYAKRAQNADGYRSQSRGLRQGEMGDALVLSWGVPWCWRQRSTQRPRLVNKERKWGQVWALPEDPS